MAGYTINSMEGYVYNTSTAEWGPESLTDIARGHDLLYPDQTVYVVISQPSIAWGGKVVAIVDRTTRRLLDYQQALAQQRYIGRIRGYVSFAKAASPFGMTLRNMVSNPFVKWQLTDAEVRDWYLYQFRKWREMQMAEGFCQGNSMSDIARVTETSTRQMRRAKRLSHNFFGHRLTLKCLACSKEIMMHEMQHCTRCLLHLPICSKTCFFRYWPIAHRADCGTTLRYIAAANGQQCAAAISQVIGAVSSDRIAHVRHTGVHGESSSSGTMSAPYPRDDASS